MSDPFTTGTVSPDGRVAFAQATYAAWLDRLLPSVDLEGAALEHRVAARDAVLAEEVATA